jgi:hypothetical protein
VLMKLGEPLDGSHWPKTHESAPINNANREFLQYKTTWQIKESTCRYRTKFLLVDLRSHEAGRHVSFDRDIVYTYWS